MILPDLHRPPPPKAAAPWWTNWFPTRIGWLALWLATASGATASAPFAATQTPGPISPTHATLTGMATPNGLPTVAWFEWGTNASLGQRTSPVEVGNGGAVQRVSAEITGLAPHAIYFYRLVASNAAAVTRGMERRFATGLRVRAWWTNSQQHLYVPAGLTNAVSVAAGAGNGLVATTEGKVVGWGALSTPPGLSNVIAVAGGNGVGQALLGDGRVVRWYNYTPAFSVASNVVAMAPGWTSSGANSLLLRSDGTVVVTRTGYPSSNPPAGLSNIVAVALSGLQYLALRADGTVVAWTYSLSGPPVTEMGLSNVVDIAAGSLHGVALMSNGTVAAWGNNNAGQTNVPPGLSNVVAIAAGGYASLALREDGSLVAWGQWATAYLNPPAWLNAAAGFACGSTFGVALANRAPQAHPGEVSVPLQRDSIIALAGSDPDGDPLRVRIVSLPAAGSFFQFTTNGRGAPILTTPAEVTDSAGRLIVVPATGGVTNPLTTLSFLVNDGNADSVPVELTIHTLSQPLVFTQRAAPVTATTAAFNGMVTPSTWPTMAWFEYGPTSDYGQSTPPVAVGDSAGVTHTRAEVAGLAANEVYHCRLVASNLMGVAYGRDMFFTTGRRLAAWGNNWWGQTELPPGLGTVTSIAAGDFGGLALTAAGKLASWGSPSLSPGDVPPDIGEVVSFSCGSSHNLALRRDGSVAAWGNNDWGQATVPPSLVGAVAVAAGQTHSLALTADGKVLAWGDNRFGQTNVPAGLSNVVAISTRGSFSLALTHVGSAVAWGVNGAGQTNLPPTATNLVAVAAAFWTGMGLRPDGTMFSWGWAGYWGGTNIVAIAAGGFHSLALREDGTLLGWPGSTQFGEAVPPAGLERVVDMAGGYLFSLALAPNVPPQTRDQSVTAVTNQPLTLALIATDPNSDPVTCRLLSLPLRGALFQYTPDGPGEAITTPDTVVTQ